jgi:lipid-A-disaccharide synthase
MRAAGVETLFDVEALSVVGLLEALVKIPSGLWMAAHLLRAARQRRTRVVVLIDAPGFNLTFASWAKQCGLRVVYYVSPQIWAWRQGRVKKVARRVDKMLTLFPFEVPFYTAAGVDAEYVGHPLLDRLPHLPAAVQAAQALGLDPRHPIVALLPGSRRHEVQRLLPAMLTALQCIRQRLPHVQGVLPVAPTIASQDIAQALKCVPVPVTIVQGQSHEALCAASFAIVASGTATLEAGLIGTPLVVVYKVDRITEVLARLLIRVPYIGLVNIVAGQRIVPELVQDEVRPQALATLALRCLEHPAEARRIRDELATLRQVLGPGDCARRAAACVSQILRLEGSQSVAPRVVHR